MVSLLPQSRSCIYLFVMYSFLRSLVSDTSRQLKSSVIAIVLTIIARLFIYSIDIDGIQRLS